MVSIRRRLTVRLLTSLLLVGPAVSAATAHPQSGYTPPPPPLDAPACVPTRKRACPPPDSAPSSPAPATSTPERFPFPGENPGSDRALAPAAAVPADPAGAVTPQGAAAAHPFPTEPSPDLTPADRAASTGAPPAESSSSSADTPDSDKAPDEAAPAPARRQLPKIEDKDAREAKDVEVARFYLTKGDFRAAYLRAKDATTIVPEDSDAQFALAESAQGLGKAEESAAAYKRYLELAPDGTRSKQARKALTTLAHK